MKKIFIIFFLTGIASTLSAQTDTSIFFGPFIPNKIADIYIPSNYQHIEGFLGFRMHANVEKRLLQIDSAILLSGFRKRPGSQTWIGEHVGKFLFSASKTYKYYKDPRIKQLMDAMVKEYIKCQLPDGYLGTYLKKDRWKDWDVWAHKYAIIGLLNYYSVTGYQPALDAAKKAANLICKTFGQEKGKLDLMTAGEHNGLAPGSILEPMVDLYRYTGNKKYLDFCKYILRAFEQPDGPKIISALQKFGKVTKVGDAKAYEMLSCFLGMLKYYKLTGQPQYLTFLQTAWKDIKLHKLYITGTSSDHEVFVSDNQLMAGNDNDMGEGCVTVTWIQFNLQLLQITGEQKYAEELERSVYNHLLAAENPQTGCVSYYTALQGKKPYRCDQGYSCCLSSVPRGISLVPEMVAGKINNIFSILMYAPGEVDDSIMTDDHEKILMKIKASTAFPLNGTASYIIMPSASKVFSLSFRVPEWAKVFTAKIGSEIYAGKAGQFLAIKRKWSAGDEVNISFDMPVEIIQGGASYPDRIAFKRGPQVLAIDSALNATLPSIHNFMQYAAYKNDLTDASEKLPTDWNWKQAYSIDVLINDKPQTIVLVPFSEASQEGSDIAVWIKASPISK